MTDPADISYICELLFWWIVLRDRNKWITSNNGNRKMREFNKNSCDNFGGCKICFLTFQINELPLLSRFINNDIQIKFSKNNFDV